MFTRFAASARRVMQRAFREAKHWQHDFVGTEHLLYGLLCDADGPAVVLLRSLNAPPDLLLEQVESSFERHDAGMALEKFPLSPASKRVFRAAVDEAAQLNHVMIGPEHLLLGILRERDCEAAQVLAVHSVTLEGVRSAVARLPPDANREAQIQKSEAPHFVLADNPTADELERWIAPPAEHGIATVWAGGGVPKDPVAALQETEAQLRRTQLLLGGLLGYAFGHWVFGWPMGLVAAAVGLGIARFHNSVLGAAVGGLCGSWGTLFFQSDRLSPWYSILVALLGGFLGSFLGDGWRFAKTKTVEQPAVHDRAKDEAAE